EFVARAFQRAGARVAAVCGRSTESARAAVETLRREYGIEAAGFDSMDQMLREAQVDIVAICSPARFHREHLEVAAPHPVHVLCEKPLWWSDERPVDEAESRRLVSLFRRRLLRLNTQWTHTLGAFRKLHGKVGAVRSFEMLLSPISEGRDMILDSAPHLISMLQALAGKADAGGVSWEGLERVRFRYGPVEVEFSLKRCLERPRPAWYAINGLKAERTIRLPTYAFDFTGGGRTVAAPDPLNLLIKDFLGGVEKGVVDEAGKDAIVDGMTLLRQLIDAAPL
ncbi:MAG TPA: Gfo/Idh/MocA family oxidoreductase, partial [Planctomycetota bacterium]|nr:Gfo/Idh/MocA family oxidoreductase [Planctomycetota bacterium]